MRRLNLFWYSLPRAGGGPRENFGDYLSKILAERISGAKVVWKNPNKLKWYESRKEIHFSIGSILQFATPNCVVWGSGMIKQESEIAEAKFRAVRGPYTRQALVNKGYRVPEVYGDPALLFPKYFRFPSEKKFLLGIIPHYVEYDFLTSRALLTDDVCVIDLRGSPFDILRRINECEYVASSSLHGLILAQAYNVPSYRITLTDKIYGDGIKYLDYFGSVGIAPYEPLRIVPDELDIGDIACTIKNNPQRTTIQRDWDDLVKKLLAACPFAPQCGELN